MNQNRPFSSGGFAFLKVSAISQQYHPWDAYKTIYASEIQLKNIDIQIPMVMAIPASDGNPAHQAICRCCLVEAPAVCKSLRHAVYPLCEGLVMSINGA